ncbi:MAG TPA: DNA polymerase III subunit delta' [Ktedonobacteraceae bacterium]
MPIVSLPGQLKRLVSQFFSANYTSNRDRRKILAIVSYFCYHDGMMSNEEQSPSQAWDMVGHDHAINTLRRAISSQRVRHAYLLTGPEHIGKTLLARRFAQTLLCTSNLDPTLAPENPCQTCLSCRKVLHNNHPDVHYITRHPDKQFIVIDQVRALQSDTARKTLEGRRNIFILEGMHETNLQAANCLLKTLEEPEPDVLLILTAPDPGLLLATILSRVQQIPMHLLTTSQIRQALRERWQVPAENAALISALAAGRMGWAVQAAEDDDILRERQAQLETLTRIPSLNTVQRFDIAQKLSAENDKIKGMLELWLLWWRDLIFAANSCPDLVVNVDMRSLLQKQATKITPVESTHMMRAILRTLEALDQNVNTRIALEVLMLDVPTLK